MNHFDAVDFSECHSEEVTRFLTLSVCTLTNLYVRSYVRQCFRCIVHTFSKCTHLNQYKEIDIMLQPDSGNTLCMINIHTEYRE